MVRLVLATWAAFLATLITFAIFWRLEHGAPSGIWALLSIVAIAGTSLTTLIVGSRRILRGPKRLLSAALIIIAFTPIVWSTIFLTNLAHATRTREPIGWHSLTRIAMFWISSVIDVQARWQYPRWEYGRHVILIDDGQTPDPARLVDAMDAHIERMAALLNQPVPSGRVRWVRGSLVGQRGRAIVAWAICEPAPDHPADLTELDRHEVAHVLITALSGPDHEPPSILGEGWAVYQSENQDQKLASLQRQRRLHSTTPLDEMIDPDWYSRGLGPAYSEGGPFVRYLIERYGPQKFFELYRGVRPVSFQEDCQRILGASWAQVESDFWRWVHERAPTTSLADASRIELGPGVNRSDWEKLLNACRAAQEDANEWPRDAAFAVNISHTRNDKAKAIASSAELRAVFDQKEAWLNAVQSDGNSRFCVLIGRDRSGVVRGDYSDHRETRETGGIASVENARDAIRRAWGFYGLPFTDPSAWLPLDSDNPKKVSRIDEIIPPPPSSHSLWKIILRRSTDDPGGRWTIELDPDFDWHIARESHEVAGKVVSQRQTKLQRIGGAVTMAESDSFYRDGDGDLQIHSQLRTLTAPEKSALQQQVEAAFPQGRRLAEIVRRPITLAIAWPALALVLMITSFALNRRSTTAACDVH